VDSSPIKTAIDITLNQNMLLTKYC